MNEFISSGLPSVSAFFGHPQSRNTVDSDISLIFVTVGTVSIATGNSVHKLQKNMIMLINSQITYKISSSPDAEAYMIYIEDKKNYFGEDAILLPKTGIFFDKFSESYRELNAIILDLYSYIEKPTVNSYYLKGAFYHFLGFMKKNGFLILKSSQVTEKSYSKLKDIIEYIERNYNEGISLNALSKVFYTNPTYLCKIFKQATGYTLIEYINRIKINNARKLLFETNMSILEISNTVGFSTPSYFNKIFKELVSLTPTQYRHQNSLKKI